MKAVWAAAGHISERQSATALDGPDSDLKQAAVEAFWVPLYELADAAFPLSPAPSAAGGAWLRAVADQLAGVGLTVRSAAETEATRFREAGPGEPAGRPAVIDAADGRTVCFGLLPCRAAPAPTTARVKGGAAPVRAPLWQVTPQPAAVATRVTRESPDPVPAPVPSPAAAPAAPDADHTTNAAMCVPQGAAQSVWHALVNELFDARARRLPRQPRDGERTTRDHLLSVAARIDSRQQELSLDGADEALKRAAAENFWVPLYALAEECFGLSRGQSEEGATWLEGARQVMASVQLNMAAPAGGDADAGRFGDAVPGADCPGRPALVDAGTDAVISRGTRPAASR